MLNNAHRITRYTCALIAVILVFLTFSGTQAFAQDGGWANGGGDTGSIGITNPGTGSTGGGDDVAGVGAVEFTPGPVTCVAKKGTVTSSDGHNFGKLKKDKEIDCSRNPGSWWDNQQQCYWELSERVAYPTSGAVEGSWYECRPYDCPSTGCWTTPVFFESPPPGVTKISPYQAATQVARELQVQPITVGMAPKFNPEIGYRRSHVGVPIWMWVENPTTETWGPWDINVTLGGQSVSATATATSVEWDMGDGNTVICEQGQAYNTAYGLQHSPSCGHIYTHTGTYTVTITTRWSFDWVSGGQSGSIALSASTTEEVTINEVQSVNVSPDGP